MGFGGSMPGVPSGGDLGKMVAGAQAWAQQQRASFTASLGVLSPVDLAKQHRVLFGVLFGMLFFVWLVGLMLPAIAAAATFYAATQTQRGKESIDQLTAKVSGLIGSAISTTNVVAGFSLFVGFVARQLLRSFGSSGGDGSAGQFNAPFSADSNSAGSGDGAGFDDKPGMTTLADAYLQGFNDAKDGKVVGRHFLSCDNQAFVCNALWACATVCSIALMPNIWITVQCNPPLGTTRQHYGRIMCVMQMLWAEFMTKLCRFILFFKSLLSI
jgi:hypothetical protein